jgi:proline iminopeptidase
MKRLASISLIIILITCLVSVNALSKKQSEKKKRETVLDRLVHLEEALILDVPEVPSFCDRLDLKKQRVNIGDCELYCEEEGEGMPLVVLHGGPGATHHYFHPHFSLAKDFAKIIYYDQRGCGLSDYEQGKGYTVEQAIDDLEGLRKALNIDKWVVLGHSFGGLLAQYYTVKYPTAVAGLVLVGSGLTMPAQLKPTRQYDFMSKEELERIKSIHRNKDLTEVQALYNAFLNGDWKRQNYYKPSRERIAQIALYEWKHDNNFNSIMSRDTLKVNLEGAFDNCPIPTLIVEGKWDLTWNTDKPGILHQNHPNSKLIMFEHSGHSPFSDEPDRFFQILRDFIDNLPAVSGSDLSLWKKHLAELEKVKKDPYLAGEMSQSEAKAIEEFNSIRKKIQKGERFEDGTTPIRAFLTFLSCLHFLDIAAFERNQPLDLTKLGTEVKEEMIVQWEKDFSQLDILRAPPPPGQPKQGEIWPIYVKKASTNVVYDTHLFVFWNGKWMRLGNVGNPADWRNTVPHIKPLLEQAGKK